MALNAPLFKALAPEFATYDPTALTLVSDQAALLVNVSVWGAKSDLGVVYMTAHMLTMAARRGAGGALSMEKVGDLQRGYFGGGAGTDELDQTAYGKEFKRVRHSLLISPLVVS